MPSLKLITIAEQEFGVPVISAATAAAFVLLCRLGLPTLLPEAGRLLGEIRLPRVNAARRPDMAAVGELPECCFEDRLEFF
jgi:hypothetical protein